MCYVAVHSSNPQVMGDVMLAGKQSLEERRSSRQRFLELLLSCVIMVRTGVV